MEILEEAQCVLDEGNICNHCLGRRFAKLSWGLSNYERGRSLRITLAMRNDEDYEEPSEEDCWVCDGAFTRIDEWVDRVIETVEGYEFDNYLVGTRTPPLIEENEKLLDEICPSEYAQSFNSEYNREVGKRVGSILGKEVEFERPDVVIILDIQNDSVEFQINSIYIYGRYRKLVRDIPQTEWPCRECDGSGCEHCDGKGYMYEESVEQLITPEILKRTQRGKAVFHGAGREDVDALMLGAGRPFVVEVKEPKIRDFDIEELQGDINDYADGKVEVDQLHFVTGNMVERVKELDASKVYRAEVEFSERVTQDELDEALNEITETRVIEQRTPKRVSHRRADKVREREVYDAWGEVQGDKATVEIHCEGGLYVKELISGDEGRTQPSLASLLGIEARIISLDVIEVKGDFLKDEYVVEEG